MNIAFLIRGKKSGNAGLCAAVTSPPPLPPGAFLIVGFDTENLLPPVWLGGESEALARLECHLQRKAWVASFGRPKMTPQSLLPSQTGLSPYLRFGCLSTRLFYYQLTDLYKKVRDGPGENDGARCIYREMHQQPSLRAPRERAPTLLRLSFLSRNFATIIKRNFGDALITPRDFYFYEESQKLFPCEKFAVTRE